MIIFLYGQDTYRLREKLRDIIEHYQKVHKSGLNLKYFEGKNLDFQDFKQKFQTATMFKEKKMMVLKNIFSNQEFKDSFLKNLQSFSKSNDIIVFQEESDVPPKDSLFNSLKENAKTQEFQFLQGQKLRNWITKEFGKHKVNIDKKALEKLINFVGNDLWWFSNEIRKLAAYKPQISEEDIDSLVKPKIETDIFKTIDAISFKNKREALSLIHKHLEKGDSHLYLLAMINFQFRNILTVKSGARLNLHPYVVRKTTQQAEKFSFQDLKKIYHRLFEVDYKIKTGRIEPQTALDLFISEV